MPHRNVYEITALLHTMLRDEPMAVREAVACEVDEYVDQIQHQVTTRVPLPMVARIVHGALDEIVHIGKVERAEQAATITCTKGCNHCCHMVVAISKAEAELLVHLAGVHSITLDVARLRRQSTQTEDSWPLQPPQDRGCPFLARDGLCAVYEDRPLSCRKYFVVSEPDLCDAATHVGLEALTWVDLHAEILTTAAFTQGGCGFMPTMLLEVLEPLQSTKGDHHATL